MELKQDLTLKKNRNSLDTMELMIHNQMARTLSRFGEVEHAKLFLISLGSLLKSNDNIARINKVELFDKFNVPKEDKEKHTRYFNMLDKMSEKTKYDITIDADTQIAGRIAYKVKRTRNEYHVYFDEEIAPILKQLKSQYTLYYIDSIIKFRSSFSISLYNYLLSWHDKNYRINKQWLSTKKLKELFGLSESDYMRKDGTFGRTVFEKKTIQVAVDEICSAGYMKIRWYKAKDKLTKKVIAYVFEFFILEKETKSNDGLEFTEIKYGKMEDIIIATEEDLNIEPDWEYDQISEIEESIRKPFWTAAITDIHGNCEFSMGEIEVINQYLACVPESKLPKIDASHDGIEFWHYHYIAQKMAILNIQKNVKNRFKYLVKMIKKDAEIAD